MKDFSNLYDGSYFTNRLNNDLKRVKSFEHEKTFLKKYMSLDGRVCDVGCSTGEFLNTIGWNGYRYGMEISKQAKELAIQKGIAFDKDILTEKDYFDTVIFRGTIQHLPDPFLYIQKAYMSLKKGGHIVFLATPNANSIVYKLWNTLPALNPRYNFYIPSDVTLKDVLESYDFCVLETDKPYLTSPYARPFFDHLKFLSCLVSRKKPTFAFWGNMMNLIAKKG